MNSHLGSTAEPPSRLSASTSQSTSTTSSRSSKLEALCSAEACSTTYPKELITITAASERTSSLTAPVSWPHPLVASKRRPYIPPEARSASCATTPPHWPRLPGQMEARLIAMMSSTCSPALKGAQSSGTRVRRTTGVQKLTRTLQGA